MFLLMFPYLKKMNTGCPVTPYVVQGICQDTPQCPVVLQEGAWVQHTQEEEDEAAEEEAEEWRS